MEKKLFKFAVVVCLIFINLIVVVNIGLAEEKNKDEYPENFIKEIHMPGHAVERLTLLMERKVLNQFKLQNKYYPGKVFNYSIRKYTVKPEFNKNRLSGNWEITCEEKNMEESLQLEQDSLIIMIKDQYILAHNKQNLIYLPVENGQIYSQESKVIYEFGKEFMRRIEKIRTGWGEM